jgi:alkane 1-monooxygenase
MTDTRRQRHPLPVIAFALVALAPLPLFALGLVQGGAWVWAGAGYMFLLTALIDRLIPLAAGNAVEGQEFPGSDLLLAIVGLAVLALMPLVTWAVAGPSDLSPLGRGLILFGAGLWLGQVGHPAAHELIHRGNRWLFRLGCTDYVAMLFGQHASAHRLVHHRHVATARDPNSAPEGLGFYRFALRAWIGSFVAGRAAETELRRRGGKGGLHPYLWHLAGSIAALALAWAIAGWAGVAAWWGLAALAQLQILVSDYVQHYGLRRAVAPDGRATPVTPQHSWNSGPWFSSALMLNAPRHSDHHAHPARPYPALRLDEAQDAPRLPWPLPIACALALCPPLWKRAIRPALRQWAPREAKVTEG